jgi:hypothetical protein
MPGPTTEQQITIDLVDAVDTIAGGVIANAIALQGAAAALREVIAPRGGGGGITFAICTLDAGGDDKEAQSEPDTQEPVSEPVEAAAPCSCGGADADGVAKEQEYTPREPTPLTPEEQDRRAAVLDAALERSIFDIVDEMDERAPCPADSVEVSAEDLALMSPTKLGNVAATLEPVEAPKTAELSTPVAESEAASIASPAAPDRDLRTAYGEDLDRIAEQFDVKRSPGETDASLRAFLSAKKRGAEAALTKGPGVTRERAADLSGSVWAGVGGSQAVAASRVSTGAEGAHVQD